MESFLLKLRLLIRTELVLMRLHIRRAAHQAVFVAVGVASILLTITMIDVAAFFYLSDYFGRAGGGLALAAVNGLLAVGMFLIASRMKLGPEAQMAAEVRELAVAQIEADAQRAEDYVNSVKSDVMQIPIMLSSMPGRDMLGMAALAPMLKAFSQALKSKQEHS
jgi:hypothetical protein